MRNPAEGALVIDVSVVNAIPQDISKISIRICDGLVSGESKPSVCPIADDCGARQHKSIAFCVRHTVTPTKSLLKIGVARIKTSKGQPIWCFDKQRLRNR